MGLAASQARYLQLTARMSNIEYEGQQINQSRTSLSQQSNALYSSLLDLEVPTAPSSKDYTYIEYSGSDGSTTFTMGSITPTGSTYTVELKSQKTGDSLQEEYGTSIVSEEPDKIKGTVTNCEHYTGNYIEGEDRVEKGESYMKQVDITTTTTPDSKTTYYTYEDGKYTKQSNLSEFKLGTTYYTCETWTEEDPSTAYNEVEQETAQTYVTSTVGYYIYDSDTGKVRPAVANDFGDYSKANGGYPLKNDVTYIKKDENGKQEYENKSAGMVTIGGHEAKLLCEYSDNESYGNYEKAIKHVFGEETETKDVYVYFTTSAGVETAHFALAEDVKGIDNKATTYTYTTGTYTDVEKKENCTMTFDSAGRITEIQIPIYENDTLIGYRNITMTATEVKDTDAYNDAYAQYEYDKYVYDKKQQELNLATEKIQEQDRNLELKLERLDSERNELDTELDALKEVIKNNIESSYKTFSG